MDQSQTMDTQWRHKSKLSEKLGWCGRQNMLWPYLKIWDWDSIFGRAVKAISPLGVCSPCLYPKLVWNSQKTLLAPSSVYTELTRWVSLAQKFWEIIEQSNDGIVVIIKWHIMWLWILNEAIVFMTKYNIICRVAWTMGQMNRRPRVWCSKYSSPPQLRYPQLRYFRSYAILNWVQKNQVKLFFPQLRYFFPPVTLFSSFSPQLRYFLV